MNLAGIVRLMLNLAVTALQAVLVLCFVRLVLNFFCQTSVQRDIF